MLKGQLAEKRVAGAVPLFSGVVVVETDADEGLVEDPLLEEEEEGLTL